MIDQNTNHDFRIQLFLWI